MRAGRSRRVRGQSSGGGTSTLLTVAVVVFGLWLATQTHQGAEVLDDLIRVVRDFLSGLVDVLTGRW